MPRRLSSISLVDVSPFMSMLTSGCKLMFKRYVLVMLSQFSLSFVFDSLTSAASSLDTVCGPSILHFDGLEVAVFA